jgi:hypothetical protein
MLRYEDEMSVPICRLCQSNPTILGSHVAPALVYRAIKSDSATGFFRRSESPNQRFQDGDKHPILCAECEQRFGLREGKFNNHIFKAYHETDQNIFDYGDWLHYFMTSVAWRTLIMDLADSSTVSRMPVPVLHELEENATIMQRYLLGENSLANSVRNHAYLFSGEGDCTPELAAAGPHFMIRRSVGGYTIWTEDGFSAVMNNLAGFWCVTLIRENPRDSWRNTIINPIGGRIQPPQKVTSWIAHAFFQDIIEFSKKHEKMSDKQRSVIEKAAKNNLGARSLRFREMDQRQRRQQS